MPFPAATEPTSTTTDAIDTKAGTAYESTASGTPMRSPGWKMRHGATIPRGSFGGARHWPGPPGGQDVVPNRRRSRVARSPAATSSMNAPRSTRERSGRSNSAGAGYRPNVMPIFLPPLRERIADIPEIVRHLLGKIGNARQRKLALGEIAAPAGQSRLAGKRARTPKTGFRLAARRARQAEAEAGIRREGVSADAPPAGATAGVGAKLSETRQSREQGSR